MTTLHLAADGFALDLAPESGGTIERFEWEGQALLRPRCSQGPLNSACFPLVPFSNRIAFGRFVVDGREFRIAPNFPGSDHPHPLHGFGWLAPWTVPQRTAQDVVLSYLHEAGEWPWRFEAKQRLHLSAGLRHEISLRNLADTPMPAGLGLHPYFPRTSQTRYHGLHRGEWKTSADGLPISLQLEDQPRDWWAGKPVSTRAVDTLYVAREGALTIAWPDRGLLLEVQPSPLLAYTHVYAPEGADFFCAEPVSHEADAINSGSRSTGLRWLQPGEELVAHVQYFASRFSATRPQEV